MNLLIDLQKLSSQITTDVILNKRPTKTKIQIKKIQSRASYLQLHIDVFIPSSAPNVRIILSRWEKTRRCRGEIVPSAVLDQSATDHIDLALNQ